MSLFHDPIPLMLLKGEVQGAIHSFRLCRSPKRLFGSLQLILVEPKMLVDNHPVNCGHTSHLKMKIPPMYTKSKRVNIATGNVHPTFQIGTYSA